VGAGDPLEQTRSNVEEVGSEGLSVPGDVRQPDDVERVISLTLNTIKCEVVDVLYRGEAVKVICEAHSIGRFTAPLHAHEAGVLKPGEPLRLGVELDGAQLLAD
jgi:hypothetical protein